MALSTYSSFYYGWRVTAANRYVDFFDGTNTLQAVLTISSYFGQELADHVASKMNDLSDLTFVGLFDRDTRKITIAADGNFSLLFGSGAESNQSAATLLGFDEADYSGAATYTSDNFSGLKYNPSFILQSYKDSSTNRKAIDGIINKSSSGVVEVVKFGDERFMECEMLFITNVNQVSGSIIRNSSTSVEDFIQFIEYATEKGKIEFSKDENDLTNYEVFLLESTDANQNGLDYDLQEMYGDGLPEYYRSGKLKFRLLE